jgi:hypothetical protein
MIAKTLRRIESAQARLREAERSVERAIKRQQAQIGLNQDVIAWARREEDTKYSL